MLFDMSTPRITRLLPRFANLHSKLSTLPTLLLPAWKECVAKTDLTERLIPRDVTTRWNSTYDMLAFVLEYRVPVDSFTAKREKRLLGTWNLAKRNGMWLSSLAKS